MESSAKRQFTITDLPYRIHDFSLVEKLRTREKVSECLNIVGILVALAGGLIFIAGPSSIRVGWGGPSLWEVLLLNPGIVLSFGVMLMVIASNVVPPVLQEIDTFITENFTLVDDAGNPLVDGVIQGEIEAEGSLNLVFKPIADRPTTEQGVR